MSDTLTPIRDDPRWSRVVARDATADGEFWYGVATTGVFCRPSCPSRRANPKNVQFFTTTAAATRAGFRACKRCRPEGGTPHADAVVRVCRLLDETESPPPLAALAAMAHCSPSHFHRVFKAATGVTPKAYAKAARTRRMRAALADTSSVTDAIYEAGFSSSGRFYENTNDTLGMTPSDYRAGGAGVAIRFAVGACSLGAILVASSDKGVCSIALGDDPDTLVRELQDRFPRATLVGNDAAYERTVAQVVGLVETPGQTLTLPLDIRGTAFQQRVWAALMKIPAGTTVSYGELAAALGTPKAHRAVASACAANELAIVIPCHRVVRRDGSLSGYRWGVERKRQLIARETG